MARAYGGLGPAEMRRRYMRRTCALAEGPAPVPEVVRGAEPDAVSTVVASLGGVSGYLSRWPDPPGLPTLRAFQPGAGSNCAGLAEAKGRLGVTAAGADLAISKNCSYSCRPYPRARMCGRAGKCLAPRHPRPSQGAAHPVLRGRRTRAVNPCHICGVHPPDDHARDWRR